MQANHAPPATADAVPDDATNAGARTRQPDVPFSCFKVVCVILFGSLGRTSEVCLCLYDVYICQVNTYGLKLLRVWAPHALQNKN